MPPKEGIERLGVGQMGEFSAKKEPEMLQLFKTFQKHHARTCDIARRLEQLESRLLGEVPRNVEEDKNTEESGLQGAFHNLSQSFFTSLARIDAALDSIEESI